METWNILTFYDNYEIIRDFAEQELLLAPFLIEVNMYRTL